MANIGEVFGATAAVVKGMGVTLKEMMSPTVTENYPDEPRSFSERFRGTHRSCSATRTGWKNAWPVFYARPPVRPAAFTSKRRRIPRNSVSAAANATRRFITSTTTAAFSAVIAWKPAPLDACITHGHGFEQASYNTSTLIYRKEDMLAPIPPGARAPVITETAEASGH